MSTIEADKEISQAPSPSSRLRGQLLAKRRVFGADTPAGHRCSNLDELLQYRDRASGEQLKNIEANIARQVADLSSLSIGENALKRNVAELSLERLREVLDYDPATAPRRKSSTLGQGERT